MKNKNVAIILLALICLIGIFFLYRKTVVAPIEPRACTEEAKQCPDGSYVGRTGPNCEFTKCPSSQIKEETASLGQKILIEGVFITPLEVVADSRCPVDVDCIWAGEISVKVKLEKGNVNKEIVLKQLIPVSFEENVISLINVIPENNTKKPVTKEDYRFTFQVVSLSAIKTGTISGMVTTSPTCPVERIPREPQCNPKPYATSINIRKEGEQAIIKTIQSNNSGVFETSLNQGSYELEATTANGSIFPRCNKITVVVQSELTSPVDISCDTGIR